MTTFAAFLSVALIAGAAAWDGFPWTAIGSFLAGWLDDCRCGLSAAAGVLADGWHAIAGQRPAARQQACARHPSRPRVPGLPVDGEPLTAAELYEFTGIMLRTPREPPADNDNAPGGQDERETR